MISDLPFVLASREQQQLFMYDWDYVTDTLFQAGGLSTLLGRFFIQFFYSPAAAVVLTLLLLGALVWLLRKQAPASLIPAFLLLASLADTSLHFDVMIACIFAAGGFAIWQKCKLNKRLIVGGLLTLVLFLLAGSAAFIFTLSALIFSLTEKKPDSLPAAICMNIFYAIIALVALLANIIPTYWHAFSPVFFYSVPDTMPWFHLLFWFAIPVSILLAGILNRFLQKGPALIASCAFALIALPAALMLFNHQGKGGAYNTLKYEYYGVREEWEELESITGKRLNYPVTANWHYLAKSWQGDMMTNLMKTRHNGPYDLIFIPDGKNISSVLPHVLYRMGNMAAAQNVSYNLLFAACGFNPSLLKMQAKIELMRGNYKVAEKYLGYLSNSLHYRKWAEEYSRFLYDDAAVEADEELGRGRRDFPEVQNFTSPGYPMHAIFAILRTNNSDKAAMEYGLAYLLLAKDIVNVALFVDEFYGTPGLQELPICAQEAVCFFADYQQNAGHQEQFAHMTMDWCRSHGVSQQTIDRMYEFQNASMRSGGAAPKGSRGTFWYYLIYDDMIFNDTPAQAEEKTAIY